MHSEDTVMRALQLLADGHNQSAVARMLLISRRTIGDWARGKLPDFTQRRPGVCLQECGPNSVDGSAESYVYLLGLYLGDGYINHTRRSVFKLRITCDSTYTQLLDRCEQTMAGVLPSSKTGRLQRTGCTDIYSYSKHWPCLFPQHGAGKKHDRLIELEPWQQALVDLDPRRLIEGLLHSDGCRVTNFAINSKTKKRYEYPRYHFSNKSDDIKRIFTNALDQLGIAWKHNNAMNISIAQRTAVAALDTFVQRKS
jgi:hypothetical protein